MALHGSLRKAVMRRMRVDIKMNKSMIRKLSQSQIQAAEMTIEAVKTDVIAKNVMPFD